MKTIISILLLLSFQTYAQKDSIPSTDSLLNFSLSGSSFTIKPMVTTTPIKFYIGGVNTTEFLKVYPNGDLFYKPSAFCDCDKCKKYEGLKKLVVPK